MSDNDCDCPLDGGCSFEFVDPTPDCCGNLEPRNCELDFAGRKLTLCWDGINHSWATHAAMESDDVVTVQLHVGAAPFPAIRVTREESPELAWLFGQAGKPE